jgi:multiple sugar transport system substrate-binding protein
MTIRTSSRRSFLVAALGATGALVAACGQTAAPTPAPTAAVKPTTPAEPTKPAASGAATAPASAAATKPADTAKPAAAAPAPGTAPVKLILDTHRGAGTKWLEYVPASFSKKFPNATVEVRLTATSQIESYAKLYAMYTAGNIGDVYTFDPADYEFYRAVPQGLVKPLDDFIARDKFDSEPFYKPFWDGLKLDGKMWGIPAWGHPGDNGLLFNELHLQEAGVAMPDYKGSGYTMDWVYETFKKLHKESGGKVDRYGAQLRADFQHMMIWSRAYGGEILSADGKKMQLSDPGVGKAFRWIYDLAQKEKVLALPGSFEGSADDLFASGKVSVLHTGGLGAGRMPGKVKDPSKVKMSFALLPKRSDGVHPSQLRLGAWMVGAKGKTPEMAWELVKDLTSRDGTIGFMTLAQSAATFTRSDIWDHEFFKNPSFQPYRDTLQTTMPNTIPANARGAELQDTFNQESQRLLLGKVPFDQGVKDINDAAQRVLDKPST